MHSPLTPVSLPPFDQCAWHLSHEVLCIFIILVLWLLWVFPRCSQQYNRTLSSRTSEGAWNFYWSRKKDPVFEPHSYASWGTGGGGWTTCFKKPKAHVDILPPLDQWVSHPSHEVSLVFVILVLRHCGVFPICSQQYNQTCSNCYRERALIIAAASADCTRYFATAWCFQDAPNNSTLLIETFGRSVRQLHILRKQEFPEQERILSCATCACWLKSVQH